MAAKEVVLAQLDALKVKYDEAVEARKKTEQDIEAVRPVRDGMSFNSAQGIKPHECQSARMWTEQHQHRLHWRNTWNSWKLSWPSCRKFTRR